MKTLTISLISLSILIFPGLLKGQKIIFPEGSENTEKYNPISGKNNGENLFFAKNVSGVVNLFSDAGQNSEYIIRAIDISEGVSFLSFRINQNISSETANGLKVYYRPDSITSWKLLAYFRASSNDWKQETLFLPENSASYNIMFEGKGDKEDIILLDNIHVDFYKNAEAFSEGNKVYVDTLYNFSSSYLKIEVSEDQISGLPYIDNTKYLTPGVPVSCPPNAIMENEPNCYTNYKDTTNFGCDSIPYRFIDLTGCNGVVCGKSGIYTENSVSRRDFDWYRLVANGSSSISLKVVADFNIRVFVVNLIGGCDGIWLYPGQDLNSIAGDTAIINIPNVTYSSDLYFWIAPNVNQTVPCGSKYVLIYRTVPVISPVIPAPSNGPCAPAQLGPIFVPDYSFYWQFAPTEISTAFPANLAYSATSPGTYYIKGIYGPLGCWTTYSSITLGSAPVVSANASPSSVCPGSQSVLSASGAVNYTWMPGNVNGAQINVFPANTTTYSVTGASGGCSVTSTATVTVNPKFDTIENQSICAGTQYIWQGQNLSTAGTFYANYLTNQGCDSTYTMHLSVDTCGSKILTLKLFLEGLYLGDGLMHQVQGISGPQYNPGVADQVNVLLYEPAPPYAFVYNSGNIELFSDGMIPVINIPGIISGSYYVVIRHRNSIETWSALPVNFGGNGNIYYDFTTVSGQAYGSNLKFMSGVYAIWGGNTTQDGVVDGSDMAAADNGSSVILTGYQPEDVNGDGVVDGSDMALIDNNSSSIVQVIRP